MARLVAARPKKQVRACYLNNCSVEPFIISKQDLYEAPNVFLEHALSENACFQLSVWCLTVHISFMCRTETRSYTEAQRCSAVMQVSQPCSPQIKPTSRTRGKALRCWYFSLKELWLFPLEPSLYIYFCGRCQPLNWGVGQCYFNIFDWSQMWSNNQYVTVMGYFKV